PPPRLLPLPDALPILLATPLTGRCVSDSPHLSCPVSPRIGKSGWQVWQSGPTVAGVGSLPTGHVRPAPPPVPNFPVRLTLSGLQGLANCDLFVIDFSDGLW